MLREPITGDGILYADSVFNNHFFCFNKFIFCGDRQATVDHQGKHMGNKMWLLTTFTFCDHSHFKFISLDV